jgi:hypothetical protein
LEKLSSKSSSVNSFLIIELDFKFALHLFRLFAHEYIEALLKDFLPIKIQVYSSFPPGAFDAFDLSPKERPLILKVKQMRDPEQYLNHGYLKETPLILLPLNNPHQLPPNHGVQQHTPIRTTNLLIPQPSKPLIIYQIVDLDLWRALVAEGNFTQGGDLVGLALLLEGGGAGAGGF